LAPSQGPKERRKKRKAPTAGQLSDVDYFARAPPCNTPKVQSLHLENLRRFAAIINLPQPENHKCVRTCTVACSLQ
jgi:hypothetical protein